MAALSGAVEGCHSHHIAPAHGGTSLKRSLRFEWHIADPQTTCPAPRLYVSNRGIWTLSSCGLAAHVA